MPKSSSEKLKTWLDKLQQESWQLELILTGFAIFLILGLGDPIDELLQQSIKIGISSSKFANAFLSSVIIKLVWFFIVINLVIHLFLRSLWIAVIGLRYVSGDIDLEQLKLAPVYKAFLQKRLKHFDHYIEALEKICSIIFAFTFLIVFIIFSCILYFVMLQTFDAFILAPIRELGVVGQITSKVIRGVLSVAAFLYFLDFITIGWLKRFKGFAKVYYPFYRLFGWLTLAPLYRPLYYNLIDNRFGRWVGLLIVPYIIIALFASSLRFQHGIYFPKEVTKYQLSKDFYDDEYHQNLASVLQFFSPSIPGKYVENDFLEVFLPYNGNMDNQALETVCPGLTPAKKEKIVLRGAFNIDLPDSFDYNIDTIMSCFQEIYRLSIDDSLYINKDWMIYQHPVRKIGGLLAIIDISHLPRGIHRLKIERFGKNIFDPKNSNNVSWMKPDMITFWKTTDTSATKSFPASDSR